MFPPEAGSVKHTDCWISLEDSIEELYQAIAPDVGICVICLHLQNTVDWLFTLR